MARKDFFTKDFLISKE